MNGEKVRNSGIDIIGDAPWGMHFCQFYQTKEDLIDVLIPYFKAGLENNEFCMWITSEPLSKQEAKKALQKAIPNIDLYLKRGQIEILPYNEWYVLEGNFDSDRVLNGWVDKLNQAIANGYDGLRLTGNTFWLEKEDWDDFVDYEEAVDTVIGEYQMIALCTYSLEKCTAAEIIDVVNNHEFALAKRDGKWETIESFEHKRAKEEANQARMDWKQTFDAVPDLIAIIDSEHKIVRANMAMATTLNMTPEECIGLPCYHAIHGTNKPPSFCPHSKLLEDRLEHTTEVHEDNLGGDFIVSASPFHDLDGNFIGSVHVARNITERKKTEKSLLWNQQRNELLADVNNRLLTSENPQNIIDDLCQKTMKFLKCDVFFNYLVDEQKGCLHLNAYSGIPQKDAEEIKWLKYGVAVCGCVALEARRIIAENIPETHDPRTDLVESYGVQAYACHPLLIENKSIGTLSFGTKSRLKFADKELEVMKAVADQISIAMNRLLSNHALKKAHDNLEELVEERTTELEGAYESLKLANNYNRSLIEASLDPLVTIGPDGKITDANKSTETITGFNRNEIIGTDFSDYFTEPEKAREGYQKVFHEGHVLDYPLEIKHKGGDITPVLYNATVYKDEYGRVIGVFAAAHDITERKKAEELVKERALELQTERDNLNSILNTTKSGVYIVNSDFELEYINSIMEKEFGPFKGQKCYEYFYNEQDICSDCKIQKAFEGNIVEWEQNRFKTNKIYDILATPINNSDGSISVLVFLYDVTRRDKAEKELEFASKYNRSLIEASLDPLVTIGPDGKITDVNSATESVTGYLRDDLIGTDFSDYFSEPEKAKSGYKQVFEEGFVRDYPLDIKHKGGNIIPVLYNASVYKDEHDNVIGVFAAARDITERKRAEAEKQKLLERTQQVAEELEVSNEELQATTEELQVANKELEFASKYNRSLIESSLDPLVTIGPDGKITDVNMATELVTGYYKDEIIGTDFSDYFSEPEKAREGYQQVFQEGRVLDYPLEIKHKGGDITPVLYNASVYKDEYGEVIGIFAAARDITERKKAEEQIQKLANVVESSDDAIISKTLDGVITSWNKGAKILYGYSADEVIGKNISILAPPSLKDEIKQFIEKIVHGERVFHYETMRLRKDGREIVTSLTLSPIFGTSGKLVGISTIARDITERKKAEKELELASKYNRSLIEASVDPLVTIGPDGKITDVNSSTESVTGCSRDELVGTDFSDYFSEPEKAREGYQQVFQEGRVLDYPLEIKYKGGGITPVLYNATVYKDEHDNVIGVFAAARDITELKKAETMLRLKLEELARSNAELEQFAYVSSHDLQEPLRMIGSYLQLLQRKYEGELDDKADKYINFAVDGATRMQDLINDLLTFSRVTTRAKEFEPTDCELILNQVLSNLEVSIKENEAIIFHDPLPEIMADSTQLVQIFQNLISNAIKFRSENTPKIYISAKKEDTQWLFAVKDNGIGIDPKHSKRIFEVFKRLHKRKEYSGTGIGLSICKKIIERHGGNIWIESEMDKGSVFYFTLPIQPVKESFISGNI